MRMILSMFTVVLSLSAGAVFAQDQGNNILATGLADIGSEPSALHSISIKPLGLVGDSVPAAAILLGTPTEIVFDGCRNICSYQFQIKDGQFVLIGIEAADTAAHQFALVGTTAQAADREEFFSTVQAQLELKPNLMTSGSTEAPEGYRVRNQIRKLEQDLTNMSADLRRAYDIVDTQTAQIEELEETLWTETVALVDAASTAQMICNNGIAEADSSSCFGIVGLDLEDAAPYFRGVFSEISEFSTLITSE